MAPTELAPAPATKQDGIGKFLDRTLADSKPAASSASPAPANDSKTPAAPADASKETAAPVPAAAPSGGDQSTDAPPPNYEAVMKQLGEQTKANKKLGRNNVELLKQMETLKAELRDLKMKYDGTYQAPAGPTPEQERAAMEFQAREAASRKVAEEKYGAETVQAKIYAEDSPYRQLISEHPWVHHRALGAENPVLEIFQILDEFEVFNKFGRTPDSVLQNVQGTIKDQLWKEWTQQAKGSAAETAGKPVATLGEARGEAGRSEARVAPAFDLSTFNRHIP